MHFKNKQCDKNKSQPISKEEGDNRKMLNTNKIFNISSAKLYLNELIPSLNISPTLVQVKEVRSNRVDMIIDSHITIICIFFYEKNGREYVQIDTREDSFCYETRDKNKIEKALDTIPNLIKEWDYRS